MDALRAIRVLAASLLVIMGIAFLVLAGFFGSMLQSMDAPPALFAVMGVVYVAVSFGLFLDKRLFHYLGVIAPLAWAAVGTTHYIMKQNPTVFPFLTGEIIVILCCCYLILRQRAT